MSVSYPASRGVTAVSLTENFDARREEPGQRGFVLVRERDLLELAALPGNGIHDRTVAVAVDQRGVVEQQVGSLIAVRVYQHRAVRRCHRRGVRLAADRLPGDPVQRHLRGPGIELGPEPRLAELAGLADRHDFDMWVDQLRRAETSIRKHRKRLEALRDDRSPRRCLVRGGPVARPR